MVTAGSSASQKKDCCPTCRHNVYPDLIASVVRFYEPLAFPRLILRTTLDIWDAITIPMWNCVTALARGLSSISSFLFMVLRFVTGPCRFVMSRLIWLVNELAEANEPSDNGRASKSSVNDLNMKKGCVEELMMMMQAQSRLIDRMTAEQLRQAEDIRTLTSTLRQLQGTHSVVAVARISVSEGGEMRARARLSVV